MARRRDSGPADGDRLVGWRGSASMVTTMTTERAAFPRLRAPQLLLTGSTAVLPISWPRSDQGSGGGRSSCGSAASGLLRRGGERRVLARVLVDKPLLLLGRVVGPLFQLDAPCRRLGGQVEGLALGGRQATRESCPGSRH